MRGLGGVPHPKKAWGVRGDGSECPPRKKLTEMSGAGHSLKGAVILSCLTKVLAMTKQQC